MSVDIFAVQRVKRESGEEFFATKEFLADFLHQDFKNTFGIGLYDDKPAPSFRGDPYEDLVYEITGLSLRRGTFDNEFLKEDEVEVMYNLMRKVKVIRNDLDQLLDEYNVSLPEYRTLLIFLNICVKHRAVLMAW